jgi:hypothetical protein
MRAGAAASEVVCKEPSAAYRTARILVHSRKLIRPTSFRYRSENDRIVPRAGGRTRDIQSIPTHDSGAENSIRLIGIPLDWLTAGQGARMAAHLSNDF